MEANFKHPTIKLSIIDFFKILCLQEVDHFDDLDDLFKNNGFKSVYKVSYIYIFEWPYKFFMSKHLIDFPYLGYEFQSSQGRTGEANDGCAIFWKDKLWVSITSKSFR